MDAKKADDAEAFSIARAIAKRVEEEMTFPGDIAARSMRRIAELAPGVDAYVVNGMPNFRRPDGLPERMVSWEVALEALVGKPIVSSDSALYWRIFKTLGTTPVGSHGQLLSSLQ